MRIQNLSLSEKREIIRTLGAAAVHAWHYYTVYNNTLIDIDQLQGHPVVEVKESILAKAKDNLVRIIEEQMEKIYMHNVIESDGVEACIAEIFAGEHFDPYGKYREECLDMTLKTLGLPEGLKVGLFGGKTN